MKSWLYDNSIEIYSTCNEWKSVVAERFIRTLTKIGKDLTVVSKNVYIDKPDKIVNKYSKTYHGTIKMKLADVKVDELGDYLRISKYKNVFAKCYTPDWPEVDFVIRKRNQRPQGWTNCWNISWKRAAKDKK